MTHPARTLAGRVVRRPGVWTGVVAGTAAVLAVGTHRLNLDYGDDFALYLRQARALVDGDVGRAVADNAAMLTADPGTPYAFSPTAYPWMTAILFAPFVRLFGPEHWNALRLVMVTVFVLWIVLFTRLLRTRLSPAPAVLCAAVVAFAVPYLAGTNSLLSELPYLLLGTVFLLVLDRLEPRLLQPSWADSWLLAAVACAVFNTRREGLAAILAVAAIQVVQRVRARRPCGTAWLRPHVAFAAAVIAFQALLPSALLPRYDGAGIGTAARKLWGPFRHAFSGLLGFGSGTTLVGTALVLLAVVGAAARLRRLADVGLITFVALSSAIAASHPAMDPRYMMLATPFVLYLAVQGIVTLAGLLPARLATVRPFVPLVVLAALAAHGLVDAAQRVVDVQRANDAHEYLLGPGDPAEEEALQAVRDHTGHDDVVAFFKARALTYLTDRPAIQTVDQTTLLREADFYLQRYDQFVGPSGFSPFLGLLTFGDEDAAALGFVEVWRNDRWVLWRLPRGGSAEG